VSFIIIFVAYTAHNNVDVERQDRQTGVLKPRRGMSTKQTWHRPRDCLAVRLCSQYADVWQILESVLILPTCRNLEILFLPLRWRYFLITISSCIYGNVRQRAQSWPVGPLGFQNSCMLILIFFTRLYLGWSYISQSLWSRYDRHFVGITRRSVWT